jgi:hypothetical protein
MRPSPLVTLTLGVSHVERAAYQACLTYHNPYYDSLINKPRVYSSVVWFVRL